MGLHPSKAPLPSQGLTSLFLAPVGCTEAWTSALRGQKGAFLESASRGTRLVPEVMTHEGSNPIKQLSPIQGKGCLPGACRRGAQPLVVLRVGMGMVTPPISALTSGRP